MTKNATTDKLVIVKKKTDGMEKMLKEFNVTNDDELDIVSDKIKQVKVLKRFIEQEKDKFVRPAKAIIAEARDKYDPYIKKCQNAEMVLKSKAAKYMQMIQEELLKKQAQIAAKVEKGSMTTETAIKKIENLPDSPKTVRTDNGSGLRLSKRKVAKIIDPDLIPKEYFVIDEVKVRRDAIERDRLGLPQIPGVIIEEESSIASI